MDLTEDAPNCFDVSERFHLKTPSLLSTFASQRQDTVAGEEYANLQGRKMDWKGGAQMFR